MARPVGKDASAGAGGWALLAIVVLAAALRFSMLGVQGFSDDEQFTVWESHMSVGDMLSTITGSERSPPLFFLMALAGSRVLGTSEVGMRLFPALLGTLTVALIYRAGARAASRRVGLAAATFAAVNPFLIWYSQEARPYALVIFLTAVGLVCLVEFWRSASDLTLAGWTIAATAALATHYFAAFIVVPQAAWLVLTGRRDRTRRLIAAALPMSIGLLLLPLAVHQNDAIGKTADLAGRALTVRLAAVPKNFLVGYAIPFETLAAVVSAVLAAVALGLAWGRSRGAERWLAGHAAALAAFAVLVPLALALVGADYVNSRNLIMALVPAVLVLGCGFAQGRAGVVALCLASALAVAVVVGVASDRRYQRRDWRGAARALGPPRTDRAVVISPTIANQGPFRVYFGRTGLLPRRVREIAVVALADYGGFGPGAGKAPDAPPRPPPRGFALSRDVSTPTYRVIVYRSRRARAVPVPVLNSLAFPHVGRAFLGQLAER
jgi:4-amino-4-deoxy-L-arabinose transferase-like glycosyltransferase